MTSPPSDPNSLRHIHRCLLALVAAGVVTRLAQFLSRQSFWEDESFLVLNFRAKSLAQLLGPLDTVAGAPQAAPPLWLLAQGWIASRLGTGEYALRLLPLCAGIAVLVLFAWLAWRVLSPVGAVAAVGLFALSDRLIWHAAEFKPYSTDVLATVLLMLLALPRGARRDAGSALVRVAAAASVLVWLSYPSLFVFAGISLALMPAALSCATSSPIARSKSPSLTLPRRTGGGNQCVEIGQEPYDTAQGSASRSIRVVVFVACNLTVLASFLAVYMLVIRRQQHPEFRDYWAEYLGDLARPVASILQVLRALPSIGMYAAGWSGPAVMALALLGIVRLWRADRQLLGVLVLPLIVTIGAGFAGLYPFDARRLCTFLVPGTLLLGGSGAAEVVEWRLRRMPGGAARIRIGVLILLLALPAVLCVIHLFDARTRSHARPIVEQVLARHRAGEPVYSNSWTQVQCYWPHGTPLSLKDLREEPPRSGRFWMILPYRPGREDERLDSFLKPARAIGRQLEAVTGEGGAAYLFEVSVPATQSAAP